MSMYNDTGYTYDRGLHRHSYGEGYADGEYRGEELGYDRGELRGEEIGYEEGLGMRGMPGGLHGEDEFEHGYGDGYDRGYGRGVGYGERLGNEAAYLEGEAAGYEEGSHRHRHRHSGLDYEEGVLEGEEIQALRDREGGGGYDYEEGYDGYGYEDPYGYGYEYGAGLVGYDDDPLLKADRDLLYADEGGMGYGGHDSLLNLETELGEEEMMRRGREWYGDGLGREELLAREAEMAYESGYGGNGPYESLLAVENELGREEMLRRGREWYGDGLEREQLLAREAELAYQDGYGYGGGREYDSGFLGGGELLYGDEGLGYDEGRLAGEERALVRGMDRMAMRDEQALARSDAIARASDLAEMEAIRRDSQGLDHERAMLDHERKLHEFRDEQSMIDSERRDLAIQEERLDALELEKLREDQRYLDETKFYEWDDAVTRGYEDRLRNLEMAFQTDNYLDRRLQSEEWDLVSEVDTDYTSGDYSYSRHSSVRRSNVGMDRWDDPASLENRIRRDPLSALDGFDYVGLGWADDYIVPRGAHAHGTGDHLDYYDRGVYYHDPSWYVTGHTPYHLHNRAGREGSVVETSVTQTSEYIPYQDAHIFRGLNGYGSLGNFSLPRLGLSSQYADHMLALRDLKMFEDALRFDTAIDEAERRRRWRERLRWEEMDLEQRRLRWQRMTETDRWRLGLGPTGFWGTRFSGRRPGVAVAGRGVGYGAGVAPGYGLGGYGGYRSIINGRPYYGPTRQQLATVYSNGRYRGNHYPLSTTLSRRYAVILTSMIQRRAPPRMRPSLAIADRAKRRIIRSTETTELVHNSAKMLELKTRLELAELRASLSGATPEMRQTAEDDIRTIRAEMEDEFRIAREQFRVDEARDMVEDARDREASRLEYERDLLNRKELENFAKTEDRLGKLKLHELGLKQQLSELNRKKLMRSVGAPVGSATPSPPPVIESVVDSRSTVTVTRPPQTVTFQRDAVLGGIRRPVPIGVGRGSMVNRALPPPRSGSVVTTTTTATRRILPPGGLRVPMNPGRGSMRGQGGRPGMLPTVRRPLGVPLNRSMGGRGMVPLTRPQGQMLSPRALAPVGVRPPLVRPSPPGTQPLISGGGRMLGPSRSPIPLGMGRGPGSGVGPIPSRTPNRSPLPPLGRENYLKTTTTTTTTTTEQKENRPIL